MATKDPRKKDSVSSQILSDGFFKTHTDSNGVPNYLYLGPGAIVVATTKNLLTNNPDEILSKAESIGNVSANPGATFLSGVSGPTEKFFYNGQDTYAYTEEETTLPPAANVPSTKKVNKRTQVNNSGFTINGDIIITGGSKGFIVTESYIGKDADISVGDILDGTIVTSVSKSNRRRINGGEYYDFTITYQEI